MAAEKAPQRQPRALRDAVDLDRFIRVPRAGRIEAARAHHQRRKKRLVETKREQRCADAHTTPARRPPGKLGAARRYAFAVVWSKRNSSAVSAENSAPATELRG